MITANIVADSVSMSGVRLTTLQLHYPRFIHAEFMTHRVFSRNASSSRAIPVQRQIQKILDEPAMPIHWGKNQAGMQAAEENDSLISLPDFRYGAPNDFSMVSSEEAWLAARDMAIVHAQAFNEAGYHKQIVNRLLEPFAHIDVLVTATEWDNFFKLRRHPDAQPEMKALADAIWEAMEASKPRLLRYSEWHLPYISQEDQAAVEHWICERICCDPNQLNDQLINRSIKVSVARCARVSYTGRDGKPTTIEQDLELYDRLLGADPIHASPAEHQATPDAETVDPGGLFMEWEHPNEWGNFRGWRQYRRMLELNTDITGN